MAEYSNFHTHSVFCDGRDTLEDIVLQAIGLGCRQLGFSSHAPMRFEADWCMTELSELEYKKEVLSLKRKYAGTIEILLGIELDYFSDTDTSDYDYVIRSVHSVLKNGCYLPIDDSEQSQRNAVERYYGADYTGFARDYYALVGKITQGARCDVIGHFDLITKYNEGDRLFDTSCEAYRRLALEAIDAIFEDGNAHPIFEYNTGAISRGHRTSGYPAEFILDYLSQRYRGRYSFLINSDAHSKENLLFGFEEARSILLRYGTEICYSFPFGAK